MDVSASQVTDLVLKLSYSQFEHLILSCQHLRLSLVESSIVSGPPEQEVPR